MPDAHNLQYLIRLLDDDSDVVRHTVLKELSAFGPFLEIELSRSNVVTSADQRHHIRNLLGQHARAWLEAEWHRWKDEPNDAARVERAMALISEFQYGPGYPSKLALHLDKLAADYRSSHPQANPLSLASFLFKSKGLRGAERDYYNPFHSNLLYVLEERRGNPLSLATIYILVGRRNGLEVDGCNFPGHFLAKARTGGEIIVVDCFNGGRFLKRTDILSLNRNIAGRISELLEQPCLPETIIGRLLRNLIHSYKQEDKPENAEVFSRFLKELEGSDASDAGEEPG